MFCKLNLKKYAKDTSGQFSILMAVGISALMLGSAVAIDTANLQKTKTRLYDIADSAALAGAAVAPDVSNDERVRVVQEFINANSGASLNKIIEGQPIIRFDDANRQVTVGFNIQENTLMAGVLGKSTVPVNATSVASYAQSSVNPISISFALDVSGSMGWNTSDGQVKIEALKQSVNLMFTQIEGQIDDRNQLLRTMRTGMSTYNTALQANTNMRAGWRDVNNAVRRLSAGGGTNSTPSLDFAYSQIIQDRAWRTANDPSYNPSLTREFIIFMTDGDNNQSSWDTSSIAVCDRMKAAGIQVFTIAFAAPAKGQALLQNCASDDLSEHYFDASNADGLREAFSEIGEEIVERSVRITT